uniref:Triokinase/FMN cyclase n=1 Tax=Heterorhabditis bacteriophora TaxID=37862 RepID=A0A1I7XLF5_HETBA
MPITKTFINQIEDVVDDALLGLVKCSDEVVFHNKCRRVVLRKDFAAYCRQGNVTLIAGGGAGHEPYPTGYVGRGFLTAAVSGSIFASPPSGHIIMALEATRSTGGCLLFLINYTGDRLNFGLAVEKFKANGGNIRVVTISDDTAIEDSSRIGPRGLAAAVLAIKVNRKQCMISGAMAETRQYSIDQIEDTANKINENSGTIGVSLYPCSIPGQGPMFVLKEQEMEIGLGIHGEPGKMREEIQRAKAIVEKTMSILRDSRKLKLQTGMKIVLMINNLGSTSEIEMNIIKGEVFSWCSSNNIIIERLLVGSYMTSLNGHGISITILKVFDDKILDLLDASTVAPGWKSACLISSNLPSQALPENLSAHDSSKIRMRLKGAQFTVGEKLYCRNVLYTTNYFIAQQELAKLTIISVCNEMCNRKEELNRLDGAAGDGDCGSTFAYAAEGLYLINIIKKSSLAFTHPQVLLEQLAEIYEQDVGGTSGALYALMLSAASEAFSKTTSSSSFVSALQKALTVIQKHGGALPGDKTMVDPLNAAVSNLMQSEDIDWEKAITEAERAAEETSTMTAGAGRASYTSHKVQNCADAGAKAISFWMRAIWNTVSDVTGIQNSI